MKKAVYLACLGILFGAGCSESKSDPCVGCQDVGPASCNNGALDAGEVCDGTLFSPGYGICPPGTTGAPKCINCQVVTTGYCNSTTPQLNVCGNGILETGERCDGSVFAVGLSRCPEGTRGMPACVNCQVITEGNCIPVAGTCQNGVLDPGEQCDGNAFAAGFESCPDGKQGKPTCHNCVVSTDSCTDVKPGECNNNGVLDPGEQCDGDEFSQGLDQCPEGTQGKPVCVGCQIVTTGVCTDIPCENGSTHCEGKTAAICKDGQWEETTCTTDQLCWEGVCRCEGFQCDGDTLLLCQEGTCLKENCTDAGMVCDSDKKECIYTYTHACHDNILNTLSSDGQSVDYNCTAEGKICTEGRWECDPHAFTCNGSVVTLTGTKFSYDCANNKNNKIACNTHTGCDEIYCKGALLMVIENGTAAQYKDCSVYENGVCSDQYKECVSTSDVEGCYVNSKDQNIYYVCDEKLCAEEVCPEACSVERGCYSPCEENKTVCQNNQVMKCTNGDWEVEKTCTGMTCHAGDCHHEVEYCDGNIYRYCIDDECMDDNCEDKGKICDPEKIECVVAPTE